MTDEELAAILYKGPGVATVPAAIVLDAEAKRVFAILDGEEQS